MYMPYVWVGGEEEMSCKDCKLQYTCTSFCIKGEGNRNADLFLIGDAPGYDEDRLGRSFVGASGDLLDHILFKLGLKRESIYLTNLIKCRPKKGELPKGEELEVISNACWTYLEKELQTVDPKVVVLLGSAPLTTLTDKRFITKEEGMEVDTIYEGARTFACFHPSYVLRSPSKECNVARTLHKACKVAKIKVKPKGLEGGFYDYEGGGI